MGPCYVYLDQNHWIYLARDYWGRTHSGAHQGIAARLLQAVESGQVRLPVSSLHFIEHLRSENAARRERLARVFDLFSRGWHMASWTCVLPTEIRRAVTQAFGDGEPVSPPVTFGRGFLFGLGPKEKALVLHGRTGAQFSLLQFIAARPGATIDLLDSLDEERRALQNTLIVRTSENVAASTERQRALRRPYGEAVGRRAMYVQYTFEHENLLIAALQERSHTIDQFLGLGLERLMEFWSSIPSLDVGCELSLYRDRQWTRKVDPNDLQDLGHLVVAIPYCDVVVTEKFWARAIDETGLAKKYCTVVCTDLADIPGI